MLYVISLDERNGMALLGRRLSRDREQLSRLRAYLGERVLYVTPYTAKLVEDFPHVRVTEDVTVREEGAAMLLETHDPAPYLRSGDELIVYRFGRHYPSTLTCTVKLDALTKLEEHPFVGATHPEMTETRYRVP